MLSLWIHWNNLQAVKRVIRTRAVTLSRRVYWRVSFYLRESFCLLRFQFFVITVMSLVSELFGGFFLDSWSSSQSIFGICFGGAITPPPEILRSRCVASRTLPDEFSLGGLQMHLNRFRISGYQNKNGYQWSRRQCKEMRDNNLVVHISPSST